MQTGRRCRAFALQRRPRWKLVRMDEQWGTSCYGKYLSQKSIRNKTVGCRVT